MPGWSCIRLTAFAGLIAGALAMVAPVDASARDAQVEIAVDHFLAGRYGAMYEALAAPARGNDADALRLLLLIQKSGHPARDHFRRREAWRDYVAATGSDVALGTGWERRLADLGDPYIEHFLRGDETPRRRLAAARFFADRGEWLHAFEIATSTLHLTGGPAADEAFGAIALSGLHDAAAAALRARISAVFQSPDPDFALRDRVRAVADFAKVQWDHRAIGIVDGLSDLMNGIGGPEALAHVSDFTRADLATLAAVTETDPSRWRRRGPSAGSNTAGADAAGGREWWRRAMASGRWLRHDIEAACTKLCPQNLRRCDTALGGGVLPRAWICLSPHAALIPDARYRGSRAELDCFRKVFASYGHMPSAGSGALAPLAERFRSAQNRGRCLPR